MKKKFVGIFLSLTVIAGGIAVNASETSSGMYESNVALKGCAYNIAKDRAVTVLLIDKETDEPVYISQIYTADNGEYADKFKFYPEKSIDSYELRVKCEGEDITGSVIEAKAEGTKLYNVELEKSAYGYFSIKPSNLYNDTQSVKFIAASYAKDGSLVNVEIKDISKYDIEADEFKYYADEKASRVKAFVMDSFNSMVSLADAQEAESKTERFRDGDVAAIAGDSIIHLGSIPSVMEHFYQTRYPNENIRIINLGIGGDTAGAIYNRLESDVYAENPNVIMLEAGVNDIGYPQHRSEITEEKRAELINSCMSNYQKINDKLNTDGKKIIYLGTSMVDENDGYTLNENYNTANYTLRVLNEKIKALAEENSSDYISLYKYANEITSKEREISPYTEVIVSEDRIHPTEAGYFTLASVILSNQEIDSVVASVELSAESNKFTNADVTVTEQTSSRVVYTYAPKAVPMAYSDWYKAAEKIYPVTDTLNKEIIKVSDLEDGSYNVRFNDGTTDYDLGSYTSAEFSEGINIAINENNPNQIISQKSFEKQKSRYWNDRNNRSLVSSWLKTGEGAENVESFKALSKQYSEEAKALISLNSYTVTIEKGE